MTTADRVNSGKRLTKNGHVEVYSDVLNLTFRCKATDPRAPRLEMFVSTLEYLAANPKKR